MNENFLLNDMAAYDRFPMSILNVPELTGKSLYHMQHNMHSFVGYNIYVTVVGYPM